MSRSVATLAFVLGLMVPIAVLPGCGGGWSSEVQRTPEFEKAALDSRKAMMDYAQSQSKKPTGGNRRAKN